MTREEALTRLRLRSHQAFSEYVENGNQENEEAALDVLAYDMAIAALRENPCDNCVGPGLAIAHGYKDMRTKKPEVEE